MLNVYILFFLLYIPFITVTRRQVPPMRTRNITLTVMVVAILGMPFVLASPVLAADGNITQVETFIRSIIKIIAGLAGLVATGFFVVGGFTYITSSGNPEHLDRAKRTILWSAIGLGVTIAAFVISNIVADLAYNAFGK